MPAETAQSPHGATGCELLLQSDALQRDAVFHAHEAKPSRRLAMRNAKSQGKPSVLGASMLLSHGAIREGRLLTERMLDRRALVRS